MKENILKTNLKTLINKYSKSDVVANIEKSYGKGNIIFLSTNSISDNRYLKNAKYSSTIMDEFEISVKNNGIYRPIICRKNKDNKYEVILGRKRYLAAKNLKINDLPVIVKNFSDEEMLLILLADLREQSDSNVVQFSIIITELMNKYNYSNKQLTALLKFSPSQISNLVKIRNLPKEVREMIIESKISYGHAKTICRLKEDEILEVVNEILKKHLSVREVEKLVNIKYKKSNKITENSRVFIRNNNILIKYYSEEEKKKILEFINKTFID